MMRVVLRLTPIAKYSVKAIDPRYMAVNGSRGPDVRCFAYVTGPSMTAHDAKKRREPIDHLSMS